MGLYEAIRSGTRSFWADLVENRPISPPDDLPESIYVRVGHLEAEWLKYRLNLEGILEELEGVCQKIDRKRAQTASQLQRLGETPANAQEVPGTREGQLTLVRQKLAAAGIRQ